MIARRVFSQGCMQAILGLLSPMSKSDILGSPHPLACASCRQDTASLDCIASQPKVRPAVDRANSVMPYNQSSCIILTPAPAPASASCARVFVARLRPCLCLFPPCPASSCPVTSISHHSISSPSVTPHAICYRSSPSVLSRPLAAEFVTATSTATICV